MEDSKIALKLEEETKGLGKIAEKLEDTIKYEFDKGIEQIDVEEMGKAIDMLKDVYEAKEKLVKSCFYAYTLEEMEKQSEEGGEDEESMDDERRGYRGQPRSQSGRFMSRGDGRRSNRGRSSRRGYEDMMMYDDMDYDEMERMRDMDRMSYGRMGYSGSGSSGGSSSGMSSGGSSSSGMSSGSMGSQGGSRGYSESGRDSREGRSGQSRRGYMEAKEKGADKQQKMKELEDYMKELSSDVTEMIGDASPEEKAMLKNKMSVLMQKIS